LYADHSLGVIHGRADRLNSLVDVDNSAFADSLGVGRSDSYYINGSIIDFSNNSANFGCTDVQTDDDIIAAQTLAPPATKINASNNCEIFLYLFNTTVIFPLFSAYFC
jgi:hypothetical protein